MSLIDDDVLEVEAANLLKAYIDPLVGSEAYIKLPWLQPLIEYIVSFLLQCNELKHSTAGHPLLELLHPIPEGTFGRHNHEWSIDPLVLLEEGNEGDGLDGLTQPHLIRQYPVDACLVQRYEPIEPIHLVVL